MENYDFKVEENSVGMRLDVFIANEFEDKSRSYIQGIIEKENATVNGKCRKSNFKLKLNDTIDLSIPDPVELNVKAEDIPLDVIYEDSDVIVINKPQDMVVHPAPGNYSGTLVNALLNHCTDLSGINGVLRPGIVHRIDKDTSGALVVAKNDNAHNSLAAQLKDHSMTRSYLALVEGLIKDDEGMVDAPIGRHSKDRIKMAIVESGKKAVTHYKVIERFEGYTLVECNLETGRTHQIRVHMAKIGHPLVGDLIYGFKKQKFNLKGQVLHAKRLGFIHPTTNKYMEFDSPIPAYFEKLITKLRNS
ncbi:RluA family pseudouridine synthase [Clostridium estertheticum]|uniref:Pseudouridine synthase n=1 Tax=Clostridium estertheticum subsp. estertheticum TaxID=1552 RepID=A0A1J0GJL2_9CLOT|nr:RluA family pseudouridine synthase [Clostridium estertheticum]APC41102.1 RNA pseudouridine synthase [Clostridium estertheticum subsp. estertheticum]MBU3074107.1 RluA family pseudouridine synthase [Clostridium estertheticum]MBU3164201.1 RluA family pseudouridine synthase [Clostridium estertheticum]MBU3170136.1 RluA family pseudouridine synthase [Clostridium estertheticum]MBU3186074.1 RluA family pseudouridine synthase [Clostridium estertheticum]